MFGFGFKSKVKKVLLKEFNYDLKSIGDVEPDSSGGQTEEKTVKNIRQKFDYEIRKIQEDSLNAVIEQAKNNYGNEYDAAIMFMLVQMNSLNIGSDDSSNFVSKNASNIRRIIPLSSHSEDEISSMLAEIQNKHENKDEETLLKQNNEFVEEFKDWVTNNKKESEKNYQNESETNVFHDGDKYVGEMKDGKPHGKGTIIWSDGEKYEGEWKNGLQNGYGTYTLTFETEWEDEDVHEEEKYEGEWKNGKKHGHGIFFSKSADKKYEGDWKDDEFHGQGTLIDSNEKYEGGWKNGERHGFGTTSRGYTGEWKNGFPHGQGIQDWSHGESDEGVWEEGYLIRGTRIIFNGNRIEGEWKEGFEWNTIETDKDGNIIEKWVNGVKQ